LWAHCQEEAKNTLSDPESDQQSSRVDFFVDPDDLNGARPGQKVTFKLVQWDDVRGYPQAKVVQTLGDAGTNEAKHPLNSCRKTVCFLIPAMGWKLCRADTRPDLRRRDSTAKGYEEK
jgi:hypothetical protein